MIPKLRRRQPRTGLHQGTLLGLHPPQQPQQQQQQGRAANAGTTLAQWCGAVCLPDRQRAAEAFMMDAQPESGRHGLLALRI